MNRRIYINIIILTVVAGFSFSNAHGQGYWEKTFGGNEDDEGYSVQQTSDGGFIIAGSRSGFPYVYSAEVLLIKTEIKYLAVFL